MKNYELIAKLMEFPAGFDIYAGGMMTDCALHSGGVIDETEEEGKIYSYSGNVVDVDVDVDGKRVFLQLD